MDDIKKEMDDIKKEMDDIKKEMDMRVSAIINDKDLHNKMYKNFLLLMEDEKFRENMKIFNYW